MKKNGDTESLHGNHCINFRYLSSGRKNLHSRPCIIVAQLNIKVGKRGDLQLDISYIFLVRTGNAPGNCNEDTGRIPLTVPHRGRHALS